MTETLRDAILEKNYDAVRELARPDNVNAPDEAGDLPLVMAAQLNLPGICWLLLGAGAEINAVNGAGNSALVAAVTMQNESVVRQLVARGADVSVRSGRDKTRTLLDCTSDHPHSRIRDFLAPHVAAAEAAAKDRSYRRLQRMGRQAPRLPGPA